MTIDFEQLVEGNDTRLKTLTDGGYSLMILRSFVSDSEAAGFQLYNGPGGSTFVVIEQDGNPGPDAINVTIALAGGLKWYLLVSPASGSWGLPWRWPLDFAVCVIGVVAGSLVVSSGLMFVEASDSGLASVQCWAPHGLKASPA